MISTALLAVTLLGLAQDIRVPDPTAGAAPLRQVLESAPGDSLLDLGALIRVTAPMAFLGTRTGTAVGLYGDTLIFTPSNAFPPFLRVILNPSVTLHVRREPRLSATELALVGLGGGGLVGAVAGYVGEETCIGAQPCTRPARVLVGAVRTGILSAATGYVVGRIFLRPRWLRVETARE